MSAFMDRWFRQLHLAAVYRPEDCWQLVCDCVTRIFDELHLVRSMARDAYIANEPTATCDTYLWATLQAHQVMAEFTKYKFDDHPAMASTITRFTVKTSPITPMGKLRSDVDKLKSTVSPLESLPSKITRMEAEITKLKSQLNSARDDVKKLKERK